MRAEVDLLVQPYCVVQGRSLLSKLVEEFQSGRWNRFRAAVAFARSSGNYEELLRSMVAFAERGGCIDLTFGADTFAGENAGSDYDAIKQLLDRLGGQHTVRVFLYHERGRTFHPKVYLFANEEARRALVVIGSSNWSTGGLWQNVEVSVMVHLDLADTEHAQRYREFCQHFDDYWTEAGT